MPQRPLRPELHWFRRWTVAHGPVAQLLWGLAGSVSLFSGCRSAEIFNPLSPTAWKEREDRDIQRMANPDGIKGPLERILPFRAKETDAATAMRNAAGREEYDIALKVYEQGDFPAAERAFKKVASKYKNSPVAEDALFMIAESQFKQERYSWAQDSYEKLVKEFPSTRHLSTCSQRWFFIGRTWLNEPEIVKAGDVQPVNYEALGTTVQPPVKNTPKRSSDPTRVVPILPNFFDRKRPMFDTDGRALQALKAVWKYDPSGPLADDALMVSAGYYLRKGDHLEADRLYTLLREQFPKSPHTEDAFVLGSHVKLMSYQGAEYDGRQLENARILKENTLKLYPKHPARERMLAEVRKIDEAKAQSDWADIVFYQRKNKTDAIRVLSRELIRRYPDTIYAEKARKLLEKIEGVAPPSHPLPEQTPSPSMPNGSAAPGNSSSPAPKTYAEPRPFNPQQSPRSFGSPPAPTTTPPGDNSLPGGPGPREMPGPIFPDSDASPIESSPRRVQL